jgi:hypothetical protein
MFLMAKAGVTATSWTWQADRENWRVAGGCDCDVDDLTLVVDIEADSIIVTIF